MKLNELHGLLETELARTVDTPPRDTILGKLAGKITLMASSYESDGLTFLASGDQVNALASFWYAFGWLHFGITYGLITGGDVTGPGSASCPVPGSSESFPPGYRAALTEKTLRYQRLLSIARSSVVCSPEQETVTGDFSQRVLFIAGVYEKQGGACISSGNNEDALASFSYGHGWLDAGVTAGLFHITEEHDLFTV